MTTEQNRAEFEAWAKSVGYDLSETTDDKYWCVATAEIWQVWEAGYAAGRKAEREAMHKEALLEFEAWDTKRKD